MTLGRCSRSVLGAERHTPWLRVSILFVGLASMGLSLAAFTLQPTARPNYVLPACLLALSLLWLGAGAALGGNANHWPDMRLDAGASLLLVGGLSLSLELAVRLVCAGRFGGFPAAFDFGLKCKEVHARSFDVPYECEPNSSFLPEFNSFGHCVQGGLSLLLLPPVEAAAASAGAPRLPPRRPLVVLLSSLVAVYPAYNLVKRTVTYPVHSFATSSFANNAAEWAMGFLLGLSFSVAATAVHAGRAGAAARATGGKERASAAQAAPPRGGRVERASLAFRACAGGMLLATSVAAAALFGASWDTDASPDQELGEGAFDAAATVGLCLVPLSLAAMAVRLRRRRGAEGAGASLSPSESAGGTPARLSSCGGTPGSLPQL